MIVRTQKSTLGVEHSRLPNKKGPCLRKTRSLASYRNIMPPSRSTKIAVSPSLPFVRSNALIRSAKNGLTRTLTSMVEERPLMQAGQASAIASDQPDVEMSDDTARPEPIPRATSPTPTEIIEEEAPYDPDTHAITLATLGIKVRDFAISPNPLRSRETFNVYNALLEFAYCVRSTEPYRIPVPAKPLHRLIASGFVPEKEVLARCSAKDIAVLRAYQTSPRVDHPWVPLCTAQVMPAKTWTSAQWDDFILHTDFDQTNNMSAL
ncbi:hypothetical protein BDZ89DRAFT_1062685 [Hymenopellis radicata]|nr:hypothetical protein BDZ89DRAFT_1062685 [Hymenopellis radicata]